MGQSGSNAGFIRSADADSLTVGSGFFMNNAGDFRFGNPSGNIVRWDNLAGQLTITGSVDATDGNIGNWIIEPIDEGGRLKSVDGSIVLNPDIAIPALEFFSGSGNDAELKLVVKPDDTFTDPSAGNIPLSSLPTDINTTKNSIPSITADETNNGLTSSFVETSTPIATSVVIPSNGIYNITGINIPSSSLPTPSTVFFTDTYQPFNEPGEEGQVVESFISRRSISYNLTLIAKNTTTNQTFSTILRSHNSFGRAEGTRRVYDSGDWVQSGEVVFPASNVNIAFSTNQSRNLSLTAGNYDFYYGIILSVFAGAGASGFDAGFLQNGTEFFPTTADGTNITFKDGSNNTTGYLSNSITVVVPTNIVELTSRGLQVTSTSNTFVRIRRNPLSTTTVPTLMETGGGKVVIGQAPGTFGGAISILNDSFDNLGTTRTARLVVGGLPFGDGPTNDAYTIGNGNSSGSILGAIRVPSIGTGTGTSLIRGADSRILLSSSSKRYKLNIEDLDDYIVSNSILNLRPVWYRSNPKTTMDRPDWSHIGLIAEEVAEIEPRLVNYNIETGSNGEEILIPESVQYDRIGVILLSHIQKQTKVIQELSKKVTDLELIISGSNNL